MNISAVISSVKHRTVFRCLCLVFSVVFGILANMVIAAEKPAESIFFSGPFYFRLPGYRNFVLQSDCPAVPVNTLVAVRPDVNNPMASSSQLLIGSYTVRMLPGASMKMADRGIVPLSGRFLFSGEGSEPLVFISRYYELRYRRGSLLIEVTPDSGTYIALRGKGDVFVKAFDRRIYDLKANQELFFPLFGSARLSKRLSGFWSDPPTGFAAARISSKSSQAEDEKDDEDLKANNEKLEGNEDGGRKKDLEQSDDLIDEEAEEPVDGIENHDDTESEREPESEPEMDTDAGAGSDDDAEKVATEEQVSD